MPCEFDGPKTSGVNLTDWAPRQVTPKEVGRRSRTTRLANKAARQAATGESWYERRIREASNGQASGA